MRRDNNGQKSDYFDLVCSLFVALVDGTIGLSVVIANVSRSHVLVTFSVGRLHFMQLFPCRARTMASFDGRCRLWPSSHVICECLWCVCTVHFSQRWNLFSFIVFSLFRLAHSCARLWWDIRSDYATMWMLSRSNDWARPERNKFEKIKYIYSHGSSSLRCVCGHDITAMYGKPHSLSFARSRNAEFIITKFFHLPSAIFVVFHFFFAFFGSPIPLMIW